MQRNGMGHLKKKMSEEHKRKAQSRRVEMIVEE
jgi:hypothetical protein